MATSPNRKNVDDMFDELSQRYIDNFRKSTTGEKQSNHQPRSNWLRGIPAVPITDESNDKGNADPFANGDVDVDMVRQLCTAAGALELSDDKSDDRDKDPRTLDDSEYYTLVGDDDGRPLLTTSSPRIVTAVADGNATTNGNDDDEEYAEIVLNVAAQATTLDPQAQEFVPNPKLRLVQTRYGLFPETMFIEMSCRPHLRTRAFYNELQPYMRDWHDLVAAEGLEDVHAQLMYHPNSHDFRFEQLMGVRR
ncbi:hypothetical protein PFICI_03876 [Pestalotiopsis fici W106-1]|uniref:Uncharacterized protein n=1 Tax=Pestalotiopsis fici (strain W106-1 / CGMCC3.15140) TaxID=1229662 RepID=W3XKU5_PESFW|nr:uncharacterized protein PFICI_03876 [Pestalotiopsis fici W106-1]ETS85851.1 hypothetical protein PFICI_03876 [Pestalotiopsis fici W106-1]